MEDFVDGFRFMFMTVQVVFFAVTIVAFLYSEGKDKASAGFWLVMMALNFWLLYQAANKGGLI